MKRTYKKRKKRINNVETLENENNEIINNYNNNNNIINDSVNNNCQNYLQNMFVNVENLNNFFLKPNISGKIINVLNFYWIKLREI